MNPAIKRFADWLEKVKPSSVAFTGGSVSAFADVVARLNEARLLSGSAMARDGTWIVGTDDEAHQGVSLPFLLEAMGKLKPETLAEIRASDWEPVLNDEVLRIIFGWLQPRESICLMGTLPCPKCGTEAEWKPWGSGDGEYDILRCPKCDEFIIGSPIL